MRTSLATAGLAAILTFTAATSARADDEPSSGGDSSLRRSGWLLDASAQSRPQMLSFFLFVPWYYGYGIGGAVRYAIPILNDGFIPKLNDSVEIEFGGDIWTASYGGFGFNGGGYTALGIPIEGRWTFHITDKFSAYGKVGIGWVIVVGSRSDGVVAGYGGGIYTTAGPGVLYKLSDAISLRAEFGYSGLRGGIGIAF
jgi:hypothetical protein